MAYLTLSSTFMGFTEVQAPNQTVTLSTTAPTIVDIQIDGPPTTNNGPGLAPNVLALSGGFKLADPVTGNTIDVGAAVAQNNTDPVHPASWFIRLVFPPQPTAITFLAEAWGIFAIYSGGTS